MRRVEFGLQSILRGAAAFFVVAAGSAQTRWYVDDDAPGDPGPGDPTVSDPLEDGSAEHPFDAIQEGIHASSDGDTVLVADGRYTGDGNHGLDFGGRLITVRSEKGPETCVIDCENVGGRRGFDFHMGETSEAVVRGFTIRNGYATGRFPDTGGGAVRCQASSPTLVNCIMSDNWADSDGGAIYLHRDSSPRVAGCTFSGNHVGDGWFGFGGAICIEADSEPLIIDCVFDGNSAAGVGGAICNFENRVAPTVANCVFVGNSAWEASRSRGGTGGGISNLSSRLDLSNCLFAGNSAATQGGAIENSGSSASISNCTFSQNTVPRGAALVNVGGSLVTVTNAVLWNDLVGTEIYTDGLSTCIVTYSCVEGGHVGEGNMDADPLFVDPANDDYRLTPGSPCIEAGDPSLAPRGLGLSGNPRFLDGDLDRVMVVDIGAYEFDHVRMAVTGHATPGGTLAVEATGTPGLLGFLLVGLAPGESLWAPWGTAFFDPDSPWELFELGTIPSTRNVEISSELLVPLDLVLQVLAIDPTARISDRLRGRAGNLSNPLWLSIE